MAETWYDPETKALVIGWEAVRPLLEEGAELQYLPAALQADDFPHKHEAADNRRRGWTEQDLLNIGHWAVRLLNDTDAEKPVLLREKHLQRLHDLHQCPNPNIFYRSLGRMPDIRRALGQPAERTVNRFKKWTVQQHVDHAAKLSERLGGRRLTAGDLDAAAAEADGQAPSERQTHPLFGGMAQLNESLGFPDFHAMSDEGLLHWGVQAVIANDAMHLPRRMITTLSARHRGPAIKLLTKRFGSLGEYKRQVYQKVGPALEYQTKKHARLMATFTAARQVAGSGQHPPDNDMPDTAKLAYAAKYEVAAACLPDAKPEDLAEVARTEADRFIGRLRAMNRALTAGQIELTASSLDVHDEIWPMPDVSRHLRLTDQELGYKTNYRKRYPL